MSIFHSHCDVSPQLQATQQATAKNSARLARGFRHRQLGMSSILLVLMIGLFVLALTCVLKMAPVYIQHMNAQSVFDSLLEEQSTRDRPFLKSEIRSLIGKRMNINQITIMALKDVEIEKTSSGNIVNAVYEVREPLIGNIDVVMKFENSVTLPLAN